jgi:hypothetical protein
MIEMIWHKYKYEQVEKCSYETYRPITGCAGCPFVILRGTDLGWDYPYSISCKIIGENIGFRASETSPRPHFCPLEEVK